MLTFVFLPQRLLYENCTQVYYKQLSKSKHAKARHLKTIFTLEHKFTQLEIFSSICKYVQAILTHCIKKVILIYICSLWPLINTRKIFRAARTRFDCLEYINENLIGKDSCPRKREYDTVKAKGGSDPKFQIFLLLVQNCVVFRVRLLKILSFLSFWR